MKKIIVINLGWEQEPLLDLIDKKGFEIYGIHYNQDYYKKPRYKDVFITDLRDLVKILNYAEKIKPDAVISDQCDYSYFAQAVIAEKFKLPGPRIKEAQIAVNKHLQRIEAKKNNILSPKFKLCASIEDVFSFIDAVKPPIILKPVDNRGSFGVNRVDNINEINEAFYDALINSHSRYILAEKFIEGIHITVDGYVFKNSGCKSLALATKKMLKSAKRQVAIDILYPGE
ncbi:MAG: ATP-grasp domain-containing protein [Deltaproteobacteria bacterium]|nr:ATP-grasp domain-containing protein [Deltaproteobacteria bacterium]